MTSTGKNKWRNVLPTVVAVDSAQSAVNIKGHLESLSHFCFPGIPVHFPIKKKIMLAKTSTWTGVTWENFQMLLVVAACTLLVMDSYFYDSYDIMRAIYTLDIAITQVFVVDFALQTYVRVSPWNVLVEFSGLMDIATIFPVFLYFMLPHDIGDAQYFAVYCCRLLRAVRLFKVLRRLTGKNKHIATFAILLVCSSFFIAGCFYYLENMEYRHHSGCTYISEATDWKPSCSLTSRVSDQDSCHCGLCYPHYQYHDGPGAPGRVRCSMRSFFEAIYFTFVSGTAIGYGDISPIYVVSRLVVIIFIIATLIAVPIQINTLLAFMTSVSPFRAAYGGSNQECHVVLSGFVNDKSKLEKFFKEFFHPDRLLTSTEEYHVVILGLSEPSEEVRSLLVSPMLDSRVTYVIGSALSVEDLKRVRADTAAGMFFLCNTEVHSNNVSVEDAATVMRSLCVANFSPDLRSLVQIIKPEDKAILKDSDVDVILCLDEFKTALVARNAICPGFSTFIENLFHSFGNISTELEESMDPWYKEYLYGARKEIYYSKLPEQFLRVMAYNFRNMGPAIFIEFGIIVLGVCEPDAQDIILNPTIKDLEKPYTTFKEFFNKYNVAVILADDQLQADELSRALGDPIRLDKIVEKMNIAERSFKTKHFSFFAGTNINGEKNSKKNLKFFAKNIVAPLKNKALTATRRLSKYVRIGDASDAAVAYKSKLVLKSASFRDSIIGDEPSSDDENEHDYVGFRNQRIASELNVSVTGKTILQQIMEKKKEMDKLELRISAASSCPHPTDSLMAPAISLNVSEIITKPFPSSSMPIATANQTKDVEEVGVSTSSKIGYVSKASKMDSNQGNDLLDKSISNDQVMMALKRKSEPPPDRSSDNSLKLERASGSAKRRSEPPPSKLSSKYDLLNGDYLGPPLAMTSPQASLEDASILEQGYLIPTNDRSPRDVFGESNTLSKKQSSDKIKSRSSEKLRKIKRQVRKNVVVVNSNKVKSQKLSSKKMSSDDAVEAFRRLESDLTSAPSRDSYDTTSPSNLKKLGSTVELENVTRLESFSSMVTKSCAPEIPDEGEEKEENVDIGSNKAPQNLLSRKSKMSNVVGTMLAVNKTVKKWTEFFGKSSCQVESAANLKRHIIVFGANASALQLFISELRRPAVRRLDYHPILIVAKEPPANWSAICNRFNDIYLLIGFPTKSTTFKNLNTKDAFSMVLFTLNDPRGKEDTSNLTTNHSSPDADALFMYLKLQQYVPDNVFFFVELRTASNVSVLNATMMRRLREDIGQPPSLLNACKHQDVSPSPPPLFSTSSKYFAATDIKGGMPNSKSKSHAKPSRKENILENKKSERLFWDAMDTHHVLPAFASGKVYVPETFETLLVQSFYNSLTPIICDKLVCGQKGQAVMQAKVPKVVEGWAFLQLYRMFCQFEVVIFGLFRAPSYRNAAPLPYVYICPAMTTIIRGGDCIMVYARNTHLIRALAAAEKLTNLDYAAGDEFSSTT